jgi:hypothetical protein
MGKFTIEQSAAAVAVQQLISDWAYELDAHNGLGIAALIATVWRVCHRPGKRHRRSATRFPTCA